MQCIMVVPAVATAIVHCVTIWLHSSQKHSSRACLTSYLRLATPSSLKRQRSLACDIVELSEGGCLVRSILFSASVVVAAMAAPVTAQAEGGFPGGFEHGAKEGYRVAGPVGAVVAAPVGGVIGGVKGFFGVDNPPPRVKRVRTVRKRY